MSDIALIVGSSLVGGYVGIQVLVWLLETWAGPLTDEEV